MQMSGSALFNLSLLTSDMWAVAVRALVFRQPVRAALLMSLGGFQKGLGSPSLRKAAAKAASMDRMAFLVCRVASF